MKYLFIGIGKLVSLSIWALCQLLIMIWHFSTAHNESPTSFYENIDPDFITGSMLRWTILFLMICIIAAIFGFGGIAPGAEGIAKIMFFIFLILFILSLIAGAELAE
jgi:uncharacterized membrane protein YtjA (UPF0391 family)